jgi:predicted ABC-type ATPase
VPEVLIVAGPNGAGKTTFASEYLPAARKRLEYVNADEIALSAPAAPQSDWHAARIMLQRIDNLVAAEQDFMFETTLASLTYARKIPRWRQRGYVVSLIYLRLPSVEASVERVRRRVAAGGHGIPEAAIRRRFGKSIRYFEIVYKSIVDEWYIWDSLEGAFALRESWDRT